MAISVPLEGIRDGTDFFVIAEVAQTHDGSLGLAHAFIDAIARTGCHAVKFQTHIAEAESTRHEPFRIPFSYEDSNRFEYWKRVSFAPDQWASLKAHAEERGLCFLSSPFSSEAVRLLEQIGIQAWKVGSGEVANPVLIDELISTCKPIFLSSGLSSWQELDTAVGRIQSAKIPLVVFHATTQYPTPPERVGLNVIGELKSRYQTPVGLSDHSGTVVPSLGAFMLGARCFEVHVTLSRDMFGPDVCASITIEELSTLMNQLRFLNIAVANPVDKDALAHALRETRFLFQKSVFAARDLSAGTILGLEHLGLKKPGLGIPAHEFGKVLGRQLNQRVLKDDPITWSMLDPEST